MNNHWVLALAKGIREPHQVKVKSFDLGGNRTHDHGGHGFDFHRGQNNFSLPHVVP